MPEHLVANKVSKCITSPEPTAPDAGADDSLYTPGRLLELTLENVVLKAELYQSEQQRREEIEFKYDLRAIAGAGDYYELGRAILRSAIKWSGAGRGGLSFMPPGDATCCVWPLQSNAEGEPPYVCQRLIRHRGQPLAQVELFFARPQPEWPWPSLKPLAFLAQFSAKIMAQLKHYHEVIYLANYDGLTGIGNRRVFDEALSREYERALRHNLPLSLIVLDLDHFKSVNDRFGHQAGDQCLRVAGRVIREAVRSSDYAARIGGEEFAVILPNTTVEQALPLARRLETAIKTTAVQVADGNTIYLTASLGLADNYFQEIISAEQLLYWADQAMYLAKKQGRDQIRVAAECRQISE